MDIEEKDSGPSIREALESAMDSQESTATEEPVKAEVSATPVPEASEQSATPEPKADGRDAKGKFTKSKTVIPTPSKMSASLAPEAGSSTATKAPESTTQTPTELKAPYSWNATAKSKWGVVPLEIQKEAVRVDREARQVMQEASEARKFHQSFKDITTPFEGIIRANGMEPLQVYGKLLQAEVSLRTSHPQQKANIAADIIRTYGVDINMLAQALDGQSQPQTPVPQQQFRDPRFDQLMTHLQTVEQQRNQQSFHAAKNEVQSFADSHEFLEELPPGEEAQIGSVRDLTARFMEADHQLGEARKRAGQDHIDMTLDQAYDLACLKHPEVSKIVMQREREKQVQVSNQNIQRKRIASSSVKNQPSTPPPSNGKMSLRDRLSDNWDMFNGG